MSYIEIAESSTKIYPVVASKKLTTGKAGK